MKKLFCIVVLVLGSTAMFAQQQDETPKNALPQDLSLAVKSIGESSFSIDKDAVYSSLNSKSLRKFSGENIDYYDFYNAFNDLYSCSGRDPIIKNMPPAGPNLNYCNIDKSSGGLYDTVVSKK